MPKGNTVAQKGLAAIQVVLFCHDFLNVSCILVNKVIYLSNAVGLLTIQSGNLLNQALLQFSQVTYY